MQFFVKSVPASAVTVAGDPTVGFLVVLQFLLSVITTLCAPAETSVNVVKLPAETLTAVPPSKATEYGPTPPDGVTLIEPPALQVALVVTRAASTPMPTCMRGNVPHLGLMVDGFAFRTAQVSFGEAEVQAKYKSTISNDSPQLMVMSLSEARGVVLVFGIGPAQATIGSRLISAPAELYLTKVPHKAKEVLVEPVLLAMVNTNVRVPLH